MQCPTCKKGEIRPIMTLLVCNRFPVCRHQEPNPSQNKRKTELIYVVFDTETTGLSKTDKIIEIGAIKVKNGQIIDEFESLINPGFYIPMNITALTGISNQDLIGQPSEEEILPKFRAWIDDAEFLVAHNLPFDARMLSTALKRLNLPAYDGGGVDTLQLSRKVLPGQKSHKLETLCKVLGVSSLSRAHRAIHDVKATFEIFEILMKRIKQQPEIKPFNAFSK